MMKRMLIDATHPEETRVVVVSGNRLDEFDYETSQKSQLKGNIYLAKVTRVEPSLQAAFVDYGGNRHGFLAFNEIHPDYYRIPISDREELLQQDAAEARAEEERIDSRDDAGPAGEGDSEPEPVDTLDDRPADDSDPVGSMDEDGADPAGENGGEAEVEEPAGAEAAGEEAETGDAGNADPAGTPADGDADRDADVNDADPRPGRGRGFRTARADRNVDTVGGDEIEDIGERRRRPLRRYRIQEVISRRQIILVQVAKEEREIGRAHV